MTHHIRRQIREAFIAALAGRTVAGGTVLGRRTWPIDGTYPAILVWTEGGPSQFGSMADTDAQRPLERAETVVVTLLVRATGGEEASPTLDDALDDFAAVVEPILMIDAGIGGLLEERQLVESRPMADLVGDVRVGTLRLTYRCLVTTPAGDPTTRV